MSSLPQLFVGQRNESILVFVDPQPRAITKRMKLVRKLRVRRFFQGELFWSLTFFLRSPWVPL